MDNRYSILALESYIVQLKDHNKQLKEVVIPKLKDDDLSIVNAVYIDLNNQIKFIEEKILDAKCNSIVDL